MINFDLAHPIDRTNIQVTHPFSSAWKLMTHPLFLPAHPPVLCDQSLIVNKRLIEATVKFLIEHDKKEFKLCVITLYIEETPDTNTSDTSNELKQILVHNCFYILGKAK